MLVLNFAWVCYFSIIFPWGAACALVNNFLELRADTYRMTKFEKRPVPRQVDGIGTWRTVLGFVVYSSIFINVGIYVLPLKGLAAWADESAQTPTEKALSAIIFLLVFERCGMLMMCFVHHFVPKVGEKVKGLLAQKGLQFKEQYLSSAHHAATAHASAVPTEIRRMHAEREQALSVEATLASMPKEMK